MRAHVARLAVVAIVLSTLASCRAESIAPSTPNSARKGIGGPSDAPAQLPSADSQIKQARARDAAELDLELDAPRQTWTRGTWVSDSCGNRHVRLSIQMSEGGPEGGALGILEDCRDGDPLCPPLEQYYATGSWSAHGNVLTLVFTPSEFGARHREAVKPGPLIWDPDRHAVVETNGSTRCVYVWK